MTSVISVLTILCAAVAGFFIWRCYVGGARGKMALKALASALFVMIGIACARGGNTGPAFYAPLLLAGLVLGFIGDIALEYREMRPSRNDAAFVAGLLFFLGGHIVYSILFLRLAPLSWVQPVAGVLALVLGCALIRRWKIQAGAMTIPVYAYLVVISVMLGSAAGVFMHIPGTRGVVLLIAAVLFYVSDTALAYILFGPKKKMPLTALNLCTYYAAQILLALSIGMAG